MDDIRHGDQLVPHCQAECSGAPRVLGDGRTLGTAPAQAGKDAAGRATITVVQRLAADGLDPNVIWHPQAYEKGSVNIILADRTEELISYIGGLYIS